MRAATVFDGERRRDGVITVEDGRMQVRLVADTTGLPRLEGVVIGGFTDHHVHLQLVDHERLADSRLGRVVDLGGEVAALRDLARAGRFVSRRPALSERQRVEVSLNDREHGTRVEFAGAFLTPPGGYPSDRAWAPTGSVREIASSPDAESAVAEMAAAGASVIKVANNSTAGPVFDDGLFRTIVDVAAAHGLPVVAHAEGPGEAQRAARLGASQLAHAPFAERLDDAEIAAQAASVSWISTLAAHDPVSRAIAIDNVRRFRAVGGTVLYGTDMGNGPTPVDLHPAELDALRQAGLDDDALLRALAPIDPTAPDCGAVLLLPGITTDPLAARLLTADDLKV